MLFRSDLLFDGLHAVEPTRAAGFARLTTELKGRAAQARYDDRLVSRASQAGMLGALLSPEEHVDVAVALVSRLP